MAVITSHRGAVELDGDYRAQVMRRKSSDSVRTGGGRETPPTAHSRHQGPDMIRWRDVGNLGLRLQTHRGADLAAIIEDFDQSQESASKVRPRISPSWMAPAHEHLSLSWLWLKE